MSRGRYTNDGRRARGMLHGDEVTFAVDRLRRGEIVEEEEETT